MSKRAPGGAERRRSISWVPGMVDDLAYCREKLVDVSRTFSKPIELLPERLRVPVTVGYLLCRVADTVEDHAGLAADARDALHREYLAVVEREADPASFVALARSLDGSRADVGLA